LARKARHVVDDPARSVRISGERVGSSTASLAYRSATTSGSPVASAALQPVEEAGDLRLVGWVLFASGLAVLTPYRDGARGDQVAAAAMATRFRM